MANSITTRPSLQTLFSTGVCVKVTWLTRKWWTRSDTWPLKQRRINCLNRQTLSGRMWMGNEDFHQPARPSIWPCRSPDVREKWDIGIPLQMQIWSLLKISSWLDAPLMICVQGKTSFLGKGAFGGLSRLWFSGEGGLARWRDGLHSGVSGRAPEEEWSVERGECHWGILTFCPTGDSEKVQMATEKWKRQLRKRVETCHPASNCLEVLMYTEASPQTGMLLRWFNFQQIQRICCLFKLVKCQSQR